MIRLVSILLFAILLLSVSSATCVKKASAVSGTCPKGQARDYLGICWPVQDCKASLFAAAGTCNVREGKVQEQCAGGTCQITITAPNYAPKSPMLPPPAEKPLKSGKEEEATAASKVIAANCINPNGCPHAEKPLKSTALPECTKPTQSGCTVTVKAPPAPKNPPGFGSFLGAPFANGGESPNSLKNLVNAAKNWLESCHSETCHCPKGCAL